MRKNLASIILYASLAGLAQAGEAETFSVETTARVEVSDGLTYAAATAYTHPGKAVFHREYPDRTITLKMDGHDFWRDEGDGPRPVEGDAMLREFILGHQVHAWLLQFGELSGAEAGCQDVEVAGLTVSARHAGRERFPKTLVPCEGRPEKLVMGYDGTLVSLEFSDWREHQGRELPFAVTFDDGSRTFLYRYTLIDLKNMRSE